MKASTFTTLLAVAGAAVAAPTPLDARTEDWGDCPAKGQYNCKTVGLVNVLTCTNILNNNKVKIPVDLDILKRGVPAYGEEEEEEHEEEYEEHEEEEEYGEHEEEEYEEHEEEEEYEHEEEYGHGKGGKGGKGKGGKGGGKMHEGSYCCTTKGLLNVATCTNILNGNVVKIPIDIGILDGVL